MLQQASIVHESKSVSFVNEMVVTTPFLNHEKLQFQKTSESSLLQHSKDHTINDDYSKLQQLLQSREASLREHAKHSHQLKLYIEDLEQKNRSLQNNNKHILSQYKTEVLELKKENDGLRKVVKQFQSQNVNLKKQLQFALHNKKHQKPSPYEDSAQKLHSDSVIKVIESQAQQSYRQHFDNSSRFQSGKGSPIFQNYPSDSMYRINSQSKEKLQVTIKSSREQRSRTLGRNQKNIGSVEMLRFESQHERSIKKLVDIKKINEPLKKRKDQVKLDKIFGEKVLQGNLHRRGFSEPRNQSYLFKQEGGAHKERFTLRNLGKQFEGQYGDSKVNTNNLDGQKRASSTRRKKDQHELIKLGHYGNPSGSSNIRKPDYSSNNNKN